MSTVHSLVEQILSSLQQQHVILGDTALSGSFRIFGSAEIRFFEPLVTENGWNATALVTGNAGGGGNTGSVLADVVCFDNAPPPHGP